MYNLLLENIARIQHAERLQEAEKYQFGASPSQPKFWFQAAAYILVGGFILVMLG